MIGLEAVQISPERLNALRSILEKSPDVFSFDAAPELASWVACLGIQKEVGTRNDELSWHLFDADTGEQVIASQVRADLIRVGGVMGVRIRVPGVERLDIRKPGLRALVHPRFSEGADGSLHQLVIFPESVARILALQGVQAVIVRAWALNTLFGGFDTDANFYEINEWELKTNDALFFAGLIERRQLAFQGSHDLASHIAGVRRENWDFLSGMAAQVREGIRSSLQGMDAPVAPSLVIPYLLGVVLDDLAQPIHAAEAGRVRMIQEGLNILKSQVSGELRGGTLMNFPVGFNSVLELGRCEDFSRIEKESSSAFRRLIQEIRANTVLHA